MVEAAGFDQFCFEPFYNTDVQILKVVATMVIILREVSIVLSVGLNK